MARAARGVGVVTAPKYSLAGGPLGFDGLAAVFLVASALAAPAGGLAGLSSCAATAPHSTISMRLKASRCIDFGPDSLFRLAEPSTNVGGNESTGRCPHLG